MTGVSPAYFISRYSDRFSPADVADGLVEISRLGFQAFELEVFHRENLTDWVNDGARQVKARADDLGLIPSQFVAHFMLDAFSSPATLQSELGLAEIGAVLQIVALFDACRTITVPLGAFDTPAGITQRDYRTLFDRCREKIGRLLARVEQAGRRLALEIMPSAIIGGIDGFLRLCDQPETDTLGVNFDTGHAWAAKENLYLVPAKLGARIFGTHLCDNFGHENHSLRPGSGSIDWPRLIGGLRTSGYEGSFDIEIMCQPEAVRQEYSRGRAFVETILSQTEGLRSVE